MAQSLLWEGANPWAHPQGSRKSCANPVHPTGNMIMEVVTRWGIPRKILLHENGEQTYDSSIANQTEWRSYKNRSRREGPGSRVFSNLEEQPLLGKDNCLRKRKRKFLGTEINPQIYENPSNCLEIQDPTEVHRWSTMWTLTWDRSHWIYACQQVRIRMLEQPGS